MRIARFGLRIRRDRREYMRGYYIARKVVSCG